jgi:hypothetical protein
MGLFHTFRERTPTLCNFPYPKLILQDIQAYITSIVQSDFLFEYLDDLVDILLSPELAPSTFEFLIHALHYDDNDKLVEVAAACLTYTQRWKRIIPIPIEQIWLIEKINLLSQAEDFVVKSIEESIGPFDLPFSSRKIIGVTLSDIQDTMCTDLKDYLESVGEPVIWLPDDVKQIAQLGLIGFRIVNAFFGVSIMESRRNQRIIGWYSNDYVNTVLFDLIGYSADPYQDDRFEDYSELDTVLNIYADFSDYFFSDFEIDCNTLIHILRTELGENRISALKYLGELECEDAVPELLETLNDLNWFVAKEAAYALWRIGTKVAQDAYFGFWKSQYPDPDPEPGTRHFPDKGMT